MLGMSKVLRSKQVEDGLAVALSYLKEEFPDCNISIIDPEGPDGVPDRDTRNGISRSFWIDFQGPQRIFFTIEVLEALATPHNPLDLNTMRQWGVADFINNAGRVPIRVTIHGPQRC